MSPVQAPGRLGRFAGRWWAAFAGGALLGAAVFLLVYGPSTLDVSYDGWIYKGYIEQDILQRYAGWLWFRNAPWSFPLTVAENFAQPYGGCITFTDSAPLAAVVCKAFGPLLPATFQYFGWLNVLNFALQGGFAALLLLRFRVGPVWGAGGCLLFVLLPPFVERAFRHDTLGAHWLILAALLCYFAARDERPLAPWLGFVLLCGGAIGLHSYFVPMVWVVFLAALLEWAGRERRVVRPALVLGAGAAATLASALVFGLLTRGGGGSADGYGLYSLNLNALASDTSYDWYAADETLRWSAFLPDLARQHHQYDGFMYLGAGLLLALLAALVYGAVRLVRGRGAALRRAGGFLRGHLWLLLACLALTVFAVSHMVTLGEATLLEVPLPPWALRLANIFRASGRMFWPCLCLLVLGLVVLGARVLRGRAGWGALALVLAVQLADIGPTLAQKHNYFAG